MKTALRRFLVAAPAFALSACLFTGDDALFSGGGGGGEDFPNTVESLGKVAVADVSSHTQWQQLQDVEFPDPPNLEGLDSLQVDLPQSAGPSSLSKTVSLTGASLDSIDLSLWQLDSSPARQQEALETGRMYAYATRETQDSARGDTLVVFIRDRFSVIDPDALLDPDPEELLESARALLDSIIANPDRWLVPLEARGTVTLKASGVRKTYRLVNLDRAGDFDEATYGTVTPLSDGGTDRKWTRLYGAEGSHRDEGTPPEIYEHLRRGAGGDTLAWTRLRDVDGDRRLWADSGSGIVELQRIVRGEEAPAGVGRLSLHMRAEMHHAGDIGGGDSLRQLFFREERRLSGGSNVSFTFEGAGESPLLRAGDTAQMVVDTVFFFRDSLIRYTADYRLLLGPVPERLDGHKLVGYGVSRNWRTGPLRSTLSEFTPTIPLPLGEAYEGDMVTVAAYFNGDTIRTEGSAGPGGVDMILRRILPDSEEAYRVVIDSAGNVTLTERLP